MVSVQDLASIGVAMLRAGAVYIPEARNSDTGRINGWEENRMKETVENTESCTTQGAGGHDTGVSTLLENSTLQQCVLCQARRYSAGCKCHEGRDLGQIDVTGRSPAADSSGTGGGDACPNDFCGEEVTIDDRRAGDADRLAQGAHEDSSCDAEAQIPGHEKSQRIKVTSCLSTLKELRTDAGVISNHLEQAHLQVRVDMLFIKLFEQSII